VAGRHDAALCDRRGDPAVDAVTVISGSPFCLFPWWSSLEMRPETPRRSHRPTRTVPSTPPAHLGPALRFAAWKNDRVEKRPLRRLCSRCRRRLGGSARRTIHRLGTALIQTPVTKRRRRRPPRLRGRFCARVSRGSQSRWAQACHRRSGHSGERRGALKLLATVLPGRGRRRVPGCGPARDLVAA
jgi:hypothetical protein